MLPNWGHSLPLRSQNLAERRSGILVPSVVHYNQIKGCVHLIYSHFFITMSSCLPILAKPKPKVNLILHTLHLWCQLTKTLKRCTVSGNGRNWVIPSLIVFILKYLENIIKLTEILIQFSVPLSQMWIAGFQFHWYDWLTRKKLGFPFTQQWLHSRTRRAAYRQKEELLGLNTVAFQHHFKHLSLHLSVCVKEMGDINFFTHILFIYFLIVDTNADFPILTSICLPSPTLFPLPSGHHHHTVVCVYGVCIEVLQ